MGAHHLPRVIARGICIATALVLVGCAGSDSRDDEAERPPAPRLDESAPTPRGAHEPATPVDPATFASRPPLALLLTAALERNPRIRAARETATAAGEGATVASWLPNPKVMVGWYETEVETRVGSQEWSVGIQQAIPYPGKIAKRSEIERVRGERALVAYERVTRDVLVDVVRTAHELVYVDAAIGISGEIAALLDRYVAAAAAGSTGSPLAEVFRAETQRVQLDHDRVILNELRAVEEQHLRSLLDLPRTAPIGTPEPGPIPRVDATLGELTSVAEQHSQELREAGLSVEIASLSSSLADDRRVPDFSVGISRIATDRLDSGLGMDPSGNGDDPIILSVGATLPIWVHTDEAAIRRARALERAASWQRVDAIQGVRDRLARAWYRLNSAARLERLYDETLVPRAALAARTAEDLLAAGKGTLAGTLETVAILHNFRLAEARARADHGRALAALEAVIGRPFDTSTPDAATEGVSR